ncbi:MAG: DDE-type integrase/transposase/recombinase [Oscillospiraceae bacterium]|nr:DDE-type integrase/transposase/recombinase [Oscillospiraceae bacterium]
MYNIITNLLVLLQVQQKIISILFVLVTCKSPKSKHFDKCDNVPYRKLIIDRMPVFDTTTKRLDYTQLLNDYFTNTGKHLKPVSRNSDAKFTVPEDLVCTHCGAPSEYLILHKSETFQYRCKVCKRSFVHKPFAPKQPVFRCPYCGKALVRIKERSCFYIWKCVSLDCSFYKDNFNNLSKKEKEVFKLKPENYKLHYLYREFTTEFLPLSSQQNYEMPSGCLSKIYSSSHTLGLILTYNINYGLSARATASILYDVHGLKISHQTVINYRNQVAPIVKPFLDNYPYEISSSIAGDETYIRVVGKWNYIFFFVDTIRKTILSYHTSPNRDTESAIIAINYVLSKFKNIPQDLAFTVDGNPIYLLAQYWFSQHNINFDIHQVIGLTNDDEISKEFRPFKQAIERHNRSFKSNARSSHGFGSPYGSVAYVALFCTYFNFLRPHMALDYNVPVPIEEVQKQPHMPAKWLKLIELSQQYILQHQLHQTA